MMKQIQRFGGAMYTPVLIFAFSGLVVGLTILLRNPIFVGTLSNPDTTWFKVIKTIEEGGWTVFRQMPILFAIGLPISLAKTSNARACMESFVVYMSYNYFISSILNYWGPVLNIDFSQPIGAGTGLTTIGGVKTLDTSIIGAIVVAGMVVYFHDKYFDKKLPDFLGIFQGSAFVVIVSFIPTLLLAVATAIIWPKVQNGIGSLQIFLASSGSLGVWIYTFLERLLIPTGLHHFIYTPFTYGPAVVDEGITKFWAENLTHFSQLTVPLKSVFPQGGFSLFGNSKIFGAIGIAIAFYFTSKSEKKKAVMGLLIPATLTAVLVGITEPLEFTFLFIAPVLFIIHSILAASMAAIMYSFGVVGSMGSGLINTATLNWIPLFKNHSTMVFTQIAIGIIFIGIYAFAFKVIIEKMDLKTPGREEDEEVKLYSKADFKLKAEGNSKIKSQFDEIAYNILIGLGDTENIVDVTNCATRLRLTVKDPNLVQGAGYFKQIGTHGVVKNGSAIQIIVGLSVPQVRESFEKLLNNSEELVAVQA